MAPASPVLPTVTVHKVDCQSVPALRGTTELPGNLQKWNVPVSLIFLFCDESSANGVLYEVGLRVLWDTEDTKC